MSVDLGQKADPKFRGWPKNFSPGDYQIWQQWIERNDQKYDFFYYDVRILDETIAPPDLEPEYRRQWLMVNAKKIDAIGVKGPIWTIIEYRVNAGLSVIGQIIGYRSLLSREKLPYSELQLLLVTNLLDKQTQSVLQETGIPFDLVLI